MRSLNDRLTTKQVIELKLENGVQLFSAQEIANLLNIIRVQEQLLKEKGNK
jgi:hypothetical protein